MVKLWRADLSAINEKAANSLADPAEYDNLFPDFELVCDRAMRQGVHLCDCLTYSAGSTVHQALKAEQLFQRKRRPATQFQAAQQEINVDLIEAAASHAGGASFAPATETASVLAAVPPSPVAAASTSPVAAAAPTSPVAVAPSSPAQVAPAATAPAADAEAPVVDDFDEEALMREVEQSTVEIGDEEASELLSKSIDELLEKDGE